MRNYKEIFQYYQIVSKELMSEHSSILKTDCYDEAFKDPIITTSDVELLEYNQDHIDEALKRNKELKITKGDIRRLPYKNNQFDLIMDFSTLDHIPQGDIPKVLSEYRRCLTGELLLITWFTPFEYKGIETWYSTDQYFFVYDTFMKMLKDFKIKRERLLYIDPITFNFLNEFLLV